MNRPFKPVAPAGVSSPSPIVGTPATPLTAADTPLVGSNTGAAREAEARAAPTFPCRHCNGAGEAEYMGLTEDRYHWRTCHVCEGSRVEAPYCDVCQGNLTVDLFCTDCDDWASLTYVERISPTRIAL